MLVVSWQKVRCDGVQCHRFYVMFSLIIVCLYIISDTSCWILLAAVFCFYPCDCMLAAWY